MRATLNSASSLSRKEDYTMRGGFKALEESKLDTSAARRRSITTFAGEGLVVPLIR